MLEYKVASGYSAAHLSEQVEQLMMRGWKVQGGVSVVMTSSHGVEKFYQAMVR